MRPLSAELQDKGDSELREAMLSLQTHWIELRRALGRKQSAEDERCKEAAKEDEELKVLLRTYRLIVMSEVKCSQCHVRAQSRLEHPLQQSVGQRRCESRRADFRQTAHCQRAHMLSL